MRRRQIEAGRAAQARPAAPLAGAAAVQVPIRDLRERSGLSIEDVAERLGMKPGAVALIERTEEARAKIRELLGG